MCVERANYDNKCANRSWLESVAGMKIISCYEKRKKKYSESVE